MASGLSDTWGLMFLHSKIEIHFIHTRRSTNKWWEGVREIMWSNLFLKQTKHFVQFFAFSHCELRHIKPIRTVLYRCRRSKIKYSCEFINICSKMCIRNRKILYLCSGNSSFFSHSVFLLGECFFLHPHLLVSNKLCLWIIYQPI